MNCVLFTKMDQVFSKENKTLKKYWKIEEKYWKSQGILSVRKGGNPDCCHFYCQDLITIPTPALEKDKESVIKSFLFFPKSYFKPCCTLYSIRKSLQSIIKVHVCNKFQENMSINVITVIHKIGTRY